MEIPKGHQPIMPYLCLPDATGFIDFTQQVFNAEVTHRSLRDEGAKIMHAQVMINGSTIMFSDASDNWPQANAQLFVYVENADVTYAKAIAAGATTVTELSDQDYGRTCGVKDGFGNIWWITSVR